MDEAALFSIMRRQHGLTSRDQALRHITEHQLEDRLRDGRWLLARKGVYGAAAVPTSWEQVLLGAVLGAGPGAVASHASAGRLWGLRYVQDAGVELVAPELRQVRIVGVVGHRSRALFDDDVTRRAGVPTTTAARTLVDLSGRFSVRQLGSSLDDALRRRVTSLVAMRRCAERLLGGPGRRMSVVHEVLAARVPGYHPGDSDLETRVLRLLVAAGLAPPRQQYRVRLGSRHVRIDLAYPDLRIAIELDTWGTHGNATSFESDRTRDSELYLAGWTPLRFTDQSSDAFIARTVRAASERFVQKTAS